MNWLIFFVGVLVGWLVEWLIDIFYWRRRYKRDVAHLAAAQGEAREQDAERELSEQLERCQQRLTELETQLAANVQTDDLTRIEGIGPKIADLLHSHGIVSFAQLAATEVETLQALLQAAGGRFRLASPETWPQQAALAMRGEWQQLRELQERLKGGRHATNA